MASAGNTSVPRNGTATLPRCSQSPDMDSFAIAQVVLLFLLFVSLGMTISMKDVRRTLRTPRGVILSQIGQFLVLPLFGWGMARAFVLPIPAAVGLVAIATAPGGAVSNIIAILYQADIPLSVCATAVSSVVAIGMMPLNQYIYMVATKLAPGVCLNVGGIILSAAIVVVGTLVGLYGKPWLQARKQFRLIKLGFLVGTISAIAIVVLGFVANLNSKMPITAAPPNLVWAALCTFLMGTVFGLGTATLAGLPRPSRVSVALEIGIQNKAVAISVLTFVFPADSIQRAGSFAMPILYALFATTLSFFWVGVAWKLGWTNLPKDKSFLEAFRTARRMAKEERANEVYGHQSRKPSITKSDQNLSSAAVQSNEISNVESPSAKTTPREFDSDTPGDQPSSPTSLSHV